MAANLAMMHDDVSLQRAKLAGLLHDCAKCIPNDKKLKLCRQNDIPVSAVEEKSPFLLHAVLGAYIAREKYDVKDQEILDAIACHTTGKPAMSLLDKILYVADYIEPRRDKAPNLPKLRRLAFEDLDEALYQILDSTRNYLKETGTAEDDTTEQTWEYYHERHVHQ